MISILRTRTIKGGHMQWMDPALIDTVIDDAINFYVEAGNRNLQRFVDLVENGTITLSSFQRDDKESETEQKIALQETVNQNLDRVQYLHGIIKKLIQVPDFQEYTITEFVKKIMEEGQLTKESYLSYLLAIKKTFLSHGSTGYSNVLYPKNPSTNITNLLVIKSYNLESDTELRDGCFWIGKLQESIVALINAMSKPDQERDLEKIGELKQKLKGIIGSDEFQAFDQILQSGKAEIQAGREIGKEALFG